MYRKRFSPRKHEWWEGLAKIIVSSKFDMKESLFFNYFISSILKLMQSTEQTNQQGTVIYLPNSPFQSSSILVGWGCCTYCHTRTKDSASWGKVQPSPNKENWKDFKQEIQIFCNYLLQLGYICAWSNIECIRWSVEQRCNKEWLSRYVFCLT